MADGEGVFVSNLHAPGWVTIQVAAFCSSCDWTEQGNFLKPHLTTRRARAHSERHGHEVQVQRGQVFIYTNGQRRGASDGDH
jgi:hypothetical protein